MDLMTWTKQYGSLTNANMSNTNPDSKELYRSFYDERRSSTYGDDHALSVDPSKHDSLQKFIDKNGLKSAKCLEIGSSGGVFQDLVEDYHGTDIAESLASYYHKPYRVAKNGRYPFQDEMFDAIWTIATYEHIPELQTALEEIVRMLKPGGLLYFAPSWQCRSWASDGYAVRPFSSLDLKGILIKASIPIRDSVFWRACFIMPKRFIRSMIFWLGARYIQIKYRRLKPNYEIYWTSDSDACNSIDPHDAILWFICHGFECLSYPTLWHAFWVRTGPLVFRKQAIGK